MLAQCRLGSAWLTRMECLTLFHTVAQLQVLSWGVSRHLSAMCWFEYSVETETKNSVKLFDL